MDEFCGRVASQQFMYNSTTNNKKKKKISHMMLLSFAMSLHYTRQLRAMQRVSLARLCHGTRYGAVHTVALLNSIVTFDADQRVHLHRVTNGAVSSLSDLWVYVYGDGTCRTPRAHWTNKHAEHILSILSPAQLQTVWQYIHAYSGGAVTTRRRGNWCPRGCFPPTRS